MHFANLMCDDHVLFTCLYVGSIQNASQEFVRFFSTLPSALKPTNDNLQELGLRIQTAFISVTIRTWTHVYVHFIAQGPPPKTKTCPPESPSIYIVRTKYVHNHTQICVYTILIPVPCIFYYYVLRPTSAQLIDKLSHSSYVLHIHVTMHRNRFIFK